jgi:type 2 lantibiotic biosynthesis protein LanM
VTAGSPNPFAAHVGSLVDGFSEAYRLMMTPARAERLIDRIRAFAGVPRRVLLRDTRTYATIQREALAPAALRDARVRGRVLDQVTRSVIVSRERPPYWAVIHAELQDLEQLDIPYFDVPLGSTELSVGTVRVGGVLDAREGGGLLQAVARVQHLSSDDLAWQVRLIRGAVHAGVGSAHAESRRARIDVPPIVEARDAGGLRGTPPDASRERAAAAVAALRDSLLSAAVRDRTGEVTWLTLRTVRDTEVLQLGLAPAGLLGGIVTFLYACADRDDDGADARAVAESAMVPVLRLVHNTDAYRRFREWRDLGLGITGVGGLLRVFEVLGRMPAASGVDWQAAGETLADALSPQLLATDRSLDVFGGIAGAIGPLARLHRSRAREGSAAVLERAAAHVLHAQDPATGGWRVPTSRQPLTGFAHGASGMGLALIEAGITLDNDQFVDAGARAFAYEASVFDEAARNWPDFRAGAPPGSCYTSWCNGAPGIALARLRALQLAPSHADAARWRDDVRVGAETTSAFPVAGLPHLCCGVLGRAAILKALGREMKEPEWSAASDSMTDRIVADADRGDRFVWGLGDVQAQGVEAPGLLHGLAGIGLHLLASEDQRDLLALIA